MRIVIEISTPKLLLLLFGVIGFLWVPGYNAFHPIQRFGDDWYGPYLFFGGMTLLVGLAIHLLWRRFTSARLADRRA
jgi:hypothetical protein